MSSNVGKGKGIVAQAREVIYNVYLFFALEKNKNCLGMVLKRPEATRSWRKPAWRPACPWPQCTRSRPRQAHQDLLRQEPVAQTGSRQRSSTTSKHVSFGGWFTTCTYGAPVWRLRPRSAAAELTSEHRLMLTVTGSDRVEVRFVPFYLFYLLSYTSFFVGTRTFCYRTAVQAGSQTFDCAVSRGAAQSQCSVGMRRMLRLLVNLFSVHRCMHSCVEIQLWY